jgi:hypothetical protein
MSKREEQLAESVDPESAKPFDVSSPLTFDEDHLRALCLGLDCLTKVFSCSTLFQPAFAHVRKVRTFRV